MCEVVRFPFSLHRGESKGRATKCYRTFEEIHELMVCPKQVPRIVRRAFSYHPTDVSTYSPEKFNCLGWGGTSFCVFMAGKKCGRVGGT